MSGQLDSHSTSCDEGAAGRVLAAISRERLAEDTAALVRTPSITGRERPCLEALATMASDLRLESELVEHDLDQLREAPGYPGFAAERNELVGLNVRLPSRNGRRLCFNGHVDVVSPGTRPWSYDPWCGALGDERILGRGSVDMKGGVIAALHAMAAIASTVGDPGCEIVLHAVSSEEDGGQGTFAALERDSDFDACIIPEPTEFRVICAQAGSLGFAGAVSGVSAHAAVRLEGISAIDRYVEIHSALHRLEEERNAHIDDPLMEELRLPYPISVGRLEAGEWFAQVPDWLRFQGRFGVRIGEQVDDARRVFETAVAAAVDDPSSVSIEWTGATFAPGVTDRDHPLVDLVRQAARTELGKEVALGGVPYGADMRLYCERGIPCVMFGTPGLERAHAVDEHVAIDDLLAVSRTMARVALAFGGTQGDRGPGVDRA